MVLLVLLLLSALGIAGPQVGHRSWDVRDGLPVSGVQDVLLGPDGYLWVATIGGVWRFDGVRFTPVDTGAGGAPRVASLERGAGDTVWLHTEQGRVLGVDAREGEVRAFDAESWHVASDGTVHLLTEGRLFRVAGEQAVAVADEALDGWSVDFVLYQPGRGTWVAEEGRVAALPAAGPVRTWSTEGLGVGEVTALMEAPDGRAWVAGTAGLAKLPPLAAGAMDGVPELLRVDGGPFGAEAVGLQEDEDGLWVGVPGGLFRVVDGQLSPPLAGDTGRPPADGLPREGPAGRRWTATRTTVLLDGEVVLRLPPGDGIVAAVVDPEDALWLATRRSGLHQVQPALFDAVDLDDGLRGDNVYAIAELDGALWIGGQYTWLSRWADGAHRWLGPEQGVPKDVMAMARDDEGTVWLGAYDEGLFRAVDPVVGGFSPVERFAGTSINALAVLGDGDLLVGSTAGLWRLRGGLWEALDERWALPDAPVRVIAEASDGTLWLGTNGGGLLRVRGDAVARWDAGDALGSDRIRAVLPVGEGAWVGTEDQGMVYVDATGPTDVKLGPAQGLPDTYVHVLIPDGLGAVWGSTNRGLFRVQEAALAAWTAGGPVPDIQHYTERDGMPDREGNGGTNHAGLRRADGTLAFASQRGVVLVDPADIDREVPPAPVRLETLRAGDRRLSLAGGDVGEVQVLAADERSFEIDYTALSFTAPQRIRFEHRLVGLDDAWVDAGELRRVRYTAVPPGDYRFELRAVDAAGRPGANTAGLALTVQPFLTERPAVRLLFVLGLLGFVAGAGLLRVAALQRREAALTRLVDAQTAQLQADNEALVASRALVAEQAERLATVDRIKTRYFSNLSHELRTPLTLILGPLDDVLAARHGPLPAEADAQLTLARRSAGRLFGLVNQLLDVVKLDAGQLRLETEPTDLVALVRLVAEELAPLAERRAQDLALDLPDAPVPVALDRREAPKIVANLLTNAIKYSPRGGRINLRVEARGGQARVAVQDSGPGIPKAAQDRIFERFYMATQGDGEVQPGTGLGLSLARELTELHGGTLQVDSDPGQGSTFTVTLPQTDAVPTALAAALDGGGPILSAGEGATPELAVPLAVPEAAAEAPAEAPAEGSADETPATGEDRTTVLVVDDNADVRSWIASHLAARFRVLQAADGAEGLRRARQDAPDLVVTDLMMPVLDGIGLLRGMRADAELDWIPVVMLTARGSVEAQVEGLERGADVYLTKPFSSQVLLAWCEGLIRQRQRLRARLLAEGPPPVESADEALVSADERYLQKLDEAIAAGMADPDFGVAELADAMAQDRSHLFRRVKELTGDPPSALLRQRRLDRGAELLLARIGNVSEVAYAVGFRSVAHFSTRFKKRFGASPTAWLADREA